ncbi:TPA: LysR substrate-binding domain-containing protein, partial [Legionella pneumophila]
MYLNQLLNRNTRSLSLTELGERILPKALLIQDTLRELQNEAEDVSSQPVGKLHIAAPRAFSVDVLSSLLSRFRLMYPQIRIELDVTNRFQDLTKSSI